MEVNSNINESLTFGFDIGIASVGWCVLGEKRIVDLGVRCFDKAETAEKGESLNLVRRTARLTRRRLRRRAWRLSKLRRLLKLAGLNSDPRQPAPVSPWKLRLEGLDRRLSEDEWARVIYHICKHRGFHWISRAEEKKAEGDNEGGKVKQGLSNTQRRMTEKGYRSAAEMVLAEFPEAQRNKQGDYSKALSRILLGEELALLFKRQREFGNPHADAELELKILGNGDRKSGLFWEQKPPLSGADLLKMLGKCTFERDEYRAPKASFTAERHVWLTRLNNLRIVADGITRPLNEAERQIALPLPYNQAGDFTYKQLRAALTKAGMGDFNFAGLAEDKEDNTLVKLPAWQAMRKALKDAGLETEWKSMAGAAIAGDPTLLDGIACVLSIFKDGAEVEAELRKLALPGGEKMIEVLSAISFDKFHALSLKALRKIVPHMEAGLRYDEACVAAGYHHSQLHDAGAGKHKYLPPFYSHREKDGRMVFNEDLDLLRNPVVLRALNQARKVLNALVRKYGSPSAVHIEMARDLSRSFDERRKIKNEQDEYRKRNEDDKAAFAAEFGFAAKSREFEKFQLYREQQGMCAYSLKPLDLHRVLHEPGYAEVDHVLPYSRSYDDSKNNKVLALVEENRNKGNRTPYEYLTAIDGEQGDRWRNFVNFVATNKSYRLAKRQRLLRKEFVGKAAEEFRERNLNDTRYICRLFKNYIERYLQFKVGADGTAAKRCVVLNGQITAFLRARWGLLKLRDDSDRHHALDAAVIAACSRVMVQRLAYYSRTKELEKARDGFPDPETGEILDPSMFRQLHVHFPEPWPHFRHELEARLGIDDVDELRKKLETFGTYSAEALETVRPLFVSRAPQRRGGGAAHKDTIYSQPDKLKLSGQAIKHISLETLTRSHFGFLEDYFSEKKRLATTLLTKKSAAELFAKFADPNSEFWNAERKWRQCELVDPLRNKEFYESLYDQLAKHEWNGKKAFANGYNKPTRRKNANVSPPVRKVAVIETLSGIPVRNGIAMREKMLRIDVFQCKRDGKYHLVPIYIHHVAIWKRTNQLPNRAIVAQKDESDWTLIDETGYNFCFSVAQNDLVRITKRTGEVIFGYYRGCDSAAASLSIALHDRFAYGNKTTNIAFSKKNPGKPIPNDKRGLIRGIGVKMASSFEKFHVDVLGNIYPAPPEQRRGLA